MKLLHCHISDFGNLSNLDFDFASNISEFCEDNGYGKSTFAAFIKSMFYGLPTTKGNGFSDRKHYYPFKGTNKFGGSLVFEMNGQEYRIERSFDKKSQTKDEVKVFCDNKQLSQKQADDIGKIVFGVEKESFERTVFIKPDVLEICATSDISAKLTNIVENAPGEKSLDEVIKILTSAAREYKAGRGDNDKINATNKCINITNQEIMEIEELKEKVKQDYVKYESWVKELDELKEKQKQIDKWRFFDAKFGCKEKLEKDMGKFNSKYPAGLLSEQELTSIDESIKSIYTHERIIDEKRLSELDRDRLTKLKTVFKEDCVDEDIKQVEEWVRKIEVNKGFLVGLTNSNDNRFNNREKVKEDIARLDNLVVDYKSEQEKILKPEETLTAKQTNKKMKYLAVSRIVVFLICLAVGIGIMFVDKIIGGILLGCGVAGSLGSIVSYCISFGSKKHQQVNPNIVETSNSFERIGKEIQDIVAHYGYENNEVGFSVEILKRDFQKYMTEQKENEMNIRKHNTDISSLHDSVSIVFRKYEVSSETLNSGLSELRRKYDEYKNLLTKEEESNKDIKLYKEEINKANQTIDDILSLHELVRESNIGEQYKVIYNDLIEFRKIKEDLGNVGDTDKYIKENNLGIRPLISDESVRELEEKTNKIKENIDSLNRDISNNEDKIGKLSDLENKREDLIEQLNDFKKRYNILTETKKMFEVADENLRKKYVYPIRDSFIYYANLIEKNLGEKVSMDLKYQVTFEREGEIRSDLHLSDGQKSICSLCLRIALINNMYDKEKPFLIMDDPFVYLDKKHMDNMRKVINSLAKDNQIIYFCCHDSRKLRID